MGDPSEVKCACMRAPTIASTLRLITVRGARVETSARSLVALSRDAL